MDEVTGGFPFFLGVFGLVVLEVLVGDSTTVQGCQDDLVFIRGRADAVFIAGIDIAATHAGLHVDEVEFHDAGNQTPVFLVEVGAGALLRGQLQIDAGGQRHLVMAVTIVTLALVVELQLPVVVGGSAILLFIGIALVGGSVGVIGDADSIVEIDIAGESTEEVHDAVDTEVVAMFLVLLIARITRAYRDLLIQRHLTHTVDGVVGVVNGLRHTVLSTLHHHAAAEDAAEVSALHGVHRTAGIARADTVLYPIFRIGFAIVLDHPLYAIKDGQHLIGRDGGTYSVGLFGIVGTLLLTLITNLVVGGLAVGEGVVLCQRNLGCDMVVVRAVVGDVQLAVAIDQRQVAVAIQTTDASTTDGDEVAVIDIVDGGGGVAEDGGGVGIHLGRTGRGVTTGEHGIVNDDTFLVDIGLAECSPFCGAGRLVAQRVEGCCRHKVIFSVCVGVANTACGSNLARGIYRGLDG